MHIKQFAFSSIDQWNNDNPFKQNEQYDLVLMFAARPLLENEELINRIRTAFPDASQIGCSTAGEICDTQVTDDTVVITAIKFKNTPLQGTSVNIDNFSDSYEAGKSLAQSLQPDGLKHVFVISDGLNVNGSALANGITDNLPKHVVVTGGLSGDSGNFEKTLVSWNWDINSNTISAIGFYGDSINIGYGCAGGWDPFGPERLITRSDNNILYEMDGKSALALYKEYLGPQAKELPASGLLFPLCVRKKQGEEGVVRTILGVDEENQSMTFAGDVLEGSYAQLMKANFDRLIDGAVDAAKGSHSESVAASPELAILISCVGRKMVLKQRIEEEVEGVREILGDTTKLTGFYSYGEISPLMREAKCELHNQTMTITTFSEK